MPPIQLGMSIALAFSGSKFFLEDTYRSIIHCPKGRGNDSAPPAFPVICLLFVALITAAQAQTWTYTFSGANFTPGGDGLSVAFQYSTQAPITADIY